MKKRTKAMLSWLLALCMLLSGLPWAPTVVAVELENVPNVAIENEDTPVDEEITIVEEDITLRGEYEKHYLMSDGSYQAVVYSSPVHELVDGVWVEIESTNQNARGSISTDTERTNIVDNYVLQGAGVQDRNRDRLYIGNRSEGLTRAFIRFVTMPTLPSGAIITHATMSLTLTNGTGTAANASAYMVTGGSWESGEIQWSNMPATDTLLQSNISHNNCTGYSFSCLTAVQHWYTGDTTGQNENYGIMLRYYDETVDDYNAVYSADYDDENNRPSLLISYQLNVRVLEGETYTLPPPNVSGTITWSSSNESVATVDASGVVTAIKAGKTIISAVVDNVVQEEFIIYVTIADGVYYIKNSNIGLYVGTYGGTTDHTAVRLFAKVTTGTSLFYQLWKITFLGSGYYSIRPMYQPEMALCSTDEGSVEIKTIGASDSLASVPLGSRWTIDHDTNGYVFRYTGSSSMTMYPAIGAPSPGLGVITAASSPTPYHQWVLEKPAYFAEIYNMYDNGYPVRHGESPSTSATTIHQYTETISSRYRELLNLEIDVHYPSYFSSALDSCKGIVTSSNVNSECAHDDEHDQRSNVIINFKSNYTGSNTCTYAFWTGHRIVSTSTAGVLDINRSCSSGYSIFILRLPPDEDSTDQNRELESIGTFMHELNHQYGARDHYHELKDKNDPSSCKFKETCSTCGTNKRPKSCIMYWHEIDISQDSVICEACKRDIIAHLDNHHIAS